MDDGCVIRICCISRLLSVLELAIRGDEFFNSVALIGCKRFDLTGNPFGFVVLSSKVYACLVLAAAEGGFAFIFLDTYLNFKLLTQIE